MRNHQTKDQPMKGSTETLLYRAAETTPELAYITGMALTASLQDSLKSSLAKDAITLGWNYTDAICALIVGVTQLNDKNNYRRNTQFTKGIINILNGAQLLALSSNFGLFSYGSGMLAGATVLAAPSFAFAMLCDLINLAIDLYELSKELNYEGWLQEKRLENAFLNKRINELNKNKNIEEEDTPEVAKLRQKILDNNFDMISENEYKLRILPELKKRYQQKRVDLVAKTFSVIGMTLMAAASLTAIPQLNLAALIICGVVASYYLYKNTQPALTYTSASLFSPSAKKAPTSGEDFKPTHCSFA